MFSFSGKILIIGGGIANFTNVSATFKVKIKPNYVVTTNYYISL